MTECKIYNEDILEINDCNDLGNEKLLKEKEIENVNLNDPNAVENNDENVVDDGIDHVKYTTGIYTLTIMASQVSLATMARMMMYTIDNAFLGHLGEAELAAASISIVWICIPLSALWSGASALVTLCGQAHGAKNGESACLWLQFGIIFTGLLGIPCVVYCFFLENFMRWSTDDEKVVELGVLFGKCFSLGVFPLLLFCCMRQYLQAINIMWPTTVTNCITIGICVVSNQILIKGIGSWEGLGFMGGPLASVVACYSQPIILFLIAFTWKGYHRESWPGWQFQIIFEKKRMKTFLKLALPIMGNGFLTTAAESIATLIAARMGTDVVSSNAVIISLWSVMWATFWGVGASTQAKVANYIGANKPKSAKRMAMIGFMFAIVIVFIIAIICFAGAREVYSLFTDKENLLDLCESVTYLLILGFIFESIQSSITGILEGMGKVKWVFFLSLLATWGINLPISLVLGLYYNWGLKCLWIAVVCQESFKVVCFSFILGLTDFKKEAEKAYKENIAKKENEASVKNHENSEKREVNEENYPNCTNENTPLLNSKEI